MFYSVIFSGTNLEEFRHSRQFYSIFTLCIIYFVICYHIKTKKNKYGQTFFHIAIDEKNYIQAIIARIFCANPNGLDNEGKTSLYYETKKSNHNMIYFLHKIGANINALNFNGTSALHCAVKNADYDTVSLLLKIGANPNLQDSDGNTPLLILLLELERSCDTMIDPYNQKRCNHLVKISMLLLDVSDINIRNNENQIALHYASMTKYYDLVCKLIEKGTIINAQDLYGNTPLHYSISSIDRNYYLSEYYDNNFYLFSYKNSIIFYLLEKGADINLLNIVDESPFHILFLQSFSIFIEYEKDNIYPLPEILLRYSVKINENTLHIMVDSTKNKIITPNIKLILSRILKQFSFNPTIRIKNKIPLDLLEDIDDSNELKIMIRSYTYFYIRKNYLFLFEGLPYEIHDCNNEHVYKYLLNELILKEICSFLPLY